MEITTIKELMESIIGTYASDSTLEGIAQVDWVWVASAVLLIVMVVTFLKAIRFVIGGFKK